MILNALKMKKQRKRKKCKQIDRQEGRQKKWQAEKQADTYIHADGQLGTQVEGQTAQT